MDIQIFEHSNICAHHCIGRSQSVTFPVLGHLGQVFRLSYKLDGVGPVDKSRAPTEPGDKILQKGRIYRMVLPPDQEEAPASRDSLGWEQRDIPILVWEWV